MIKHMEAWKWWKTDIDEKKKNETYEHPEMILD